MTVASCPAPRAAGGFAQDAPGREPGAGAFTGRTTLGMGPVDGLREAVVWPSPGCARDHWLGPCRTTGSHPGRRTRRLPGRPAQPAAARHPSEAPRPVSSRSARPRAERTRRTSTPSPARGTKPPLSPPRATRAAEPTTAAPLAHPAPSADPYSPSRHNRAIGARTMDSHRALDECLLSDRRDLPRAAARRRSPTVTVTVCLACCCQRSGHESCAQWGLVPYAPSDAIDNRHLRAPRGPWRRGTSLAIARHVHRPHGRAGRRLPRRGLRPDGLRGEAATI